MSLRRPAPPAVPCAQPGVPAPQTHRPRPSRESHALQGSQVSRGWSRRRRDDRGTSVIELAVLAPAFLMIIMLIVQFGLWFNARQAALAAAQAGAQIAREDAATTGNWQSLAQQASSSYYDSLNTSLLSSLQANAHGDPANQVFVTVAGPTGCSGFNFLSLRLTGA